MQNESQQTEKMKFHKYKMETKFLPATLMQFEESGTTLEQLQFLERMVHRLEDWLIPKFPTNFLS